jgi:glycosyltransferase involved in cell wall biosynthesis
LDRLLTALVEMNDTFDLHLIHYQRTDHAIYGRAQEVLIPRQPWRAAQVLRRFNFTILHYNPLTIFSPIHGLPARKVATVHGAMEHFLPRNFSLARRLHARLVKPYYCRQMDLIFTVSETSRSFLANRYRIAPHRLCVVPNAADRRFRPLTEDEMQGVRRRYARGRRFLLHISKFSRRKSPWLVLNAFARLRQSVPDDIALVVAGSGWPENRQVRDYVRKHHLQDAVHLTGYVTTAELPRLLNRAEAFIFPSAYEGFGMPNLEAMACGCPVITSQAFAIPEVVGNAALMVRDLRDPAELAELIRRVLTDEPLRKSLVARGLRRAAEFSWRTSAAITLRQYQRIAESA